MKMLDPSLRAPPAHQPYAGPASAFRNSPPASALPWPKSFKSSTPKSESQIIDSPYTTPTSPSKNGKQTASISPQSTHEITTTKGKTTKNFLTLPKPANNESSMSHTTSKTYSQLQSPHTQSRQIRKDPILRKPRRKMDTTCSRNNNHHHHQPTQPHPNNRTTTTTQAYSKTNDPKLAITNCRKPNGRTD